MRGSISLSTALCEHHPEIIELCRERDWEFFSHGIYNTRYSYGLNEAQERAIIEDAMRTIRRHTGQHCDGYLAPALTHTEVTMDLFAEAGGIYTCDLFHDDQPTPVRVRSGKPFISVPYSLEMNDTIVYVVNKIEPRRYAEMLKANFDRLYAEGADNGVVMCIPLHAYQVSHPHRLKAFEEALEYITGHLGRLGHHRPGDRRALHRTSLRCGRGRHRGERSGLTCPWIPAISSIRIAAMAWIMTATTGPCWPTVTPVTWPGGKRLALWVNVALQYLPAEPAGQAVSAGRRHDDELPGPASLHAARIR